MTVTTVNIVCDIGLSDNTEFTAARLDFTPSGPDYDTVSNDSIPAVTVSVDLDASGTGTAALWPVTRGTQNTTYAVSVIGTRVENGQTVARAYSLGRIAPPEAGAPHNLADLLAQSAGGIEAGSTIYATLADAVAAAVAAANQAELIAGGVLDDDLLPLEHASRAALVSAVSGGLSIVNGFTYRAGGVEFIGSTAATAISDLPGMLPKEPVTPQHFGTINGTADAATIQAMWDYTTFGSDIYFPSDIQYGINDTIDAPISYRNVDATGARFVLSVNDFAFDLNPTFNSSSVEATSQQYGTWTGGTFTSTVVSPTATGALKVHGCRQVKVQDTVIGSLVSGQVYGSMAYGISVTALGGNKFINNRLFYTKKGFWSPELGVVGVSGPLTTSIFQGNEFTINPSDPDQMAFHFEAGYSRIIIQGGFANGNAGTIMRFTDHNEAKSLTIIGFGFEQAVAGASPSALSSFLWLEAVAGGAGHSQPLLNSVFFGGNPAGGNHVHVIAEKTRRMVWRSVWAEANQSAGNWSLTMDAACAQFEADSGCRMVDASLMTTACVSLDAAVDREEVIFPSRYLTNPLTLTGYNGNAFSTTTVTLDMATLITGARYPLYGVPPRGYTIRVQARDSDSAGTAARMVEIARSSGAATTDRTVIDLDGVTNDRRVERTFYINANTDGSIWANIVASGTGTLDLWIAVLAIHN